MQYQVKRTSHLPDRVAQQVLTFAGTTRNASLAEVTQQLRDQFPGWLIQGTPTSTTLRRSTRDPVSLEIIE